MTERATKPGRGRRLNGEGTISERKDGRWEAKLTLPNGKRRTVYGKTAQEAKDKLKALMRDQEQGRDLTKGRVKTGDFLARWLDEVAAKRLGAASLARYRTIVRLHLTPEIGNVYLDALTPAKLQSVLNAKAASGLAPGTVKYCRDVLRSALSQAERWGMVSKNVAKLVEVPKAAPKRTVPLSAEQARALIAGTADDRYGPLWAMALYTGMRQGELLGLRWADLDLDAGRLTVRQALKRVGSEYSYGAPKSRTSRRTIPSPAAAVSVLRHHRKAQNVERLQSGGNWQDTELVFCRRDGSPLDGRRVTRRLQEALDRHGLPNTTFHALRHSCASLLIANGESLAKVSRLLGHSTVQLTLDTYGHLSADALAGTADAVDRLFATPAVVTTA